MDKISELSLDRTFSLLGRGQLTISPEKIIIYGLFFMGIVIFVNWLLSLTVIVVKPFLYAALMLAVIRPDFIQSLTAEDSVRRLIDAFKVFIRTFALNAMEMFHLFCLNFTRSS